MTGMAFEPLNAVLRRLRDGQTTSARLTRAALARIESCRHLNAFVRLDADEALDAAAALDARGDYTAPLAGVPMAHKDMFYRAGKVSTCGSRIFAGQPAGTTATALARLDAAGAVDLGTLHMAEFAHNSTGHNSFLGPARNPWNPDHITGGSSSGSAVAVAAGMAWCALGSDTGGSIRLPAHFCGVVGVKPTQGLVSRHGAMPLSFSLDTVGPVARSAEDAAIVLEQIAGPDPADATTEAGFEARYADACRADVRGMTVAIPDRFYCEGLSPDVARVLDEAAASFAAIGVRVRSVRLPDQDGLSAAQLVLVASEAASQHCGMLAAGADYDPQIRNRLRNGLGYSAQDYLRAVRSRGPALRAHLEACEGIDALLTPVAPFDAPTLAETDVGGSPDAESLIQSISRFMRPANYLGTPALAFPAGFSGRGLPVGLQLVGRPFAERTLFAMAAAFERKAGIHRHRPPGADA